VAAPSLPVAAAPGAGAPRSLYIVGPTYDWLLFLLPPVLALGLGILISGTPFSDETFELWTGEETTWAGLAIGCFVHAHLVIVFFRSHANPGIRALHPYRFLLVPPLLFAAMISSLWVLVAVSVLATFWDVYHSALQTFGFARIYDGKAGNSPELGRRLDWWVNQLLYCGPILAGATMMDHFEDFGEFEQVEGPVAAFLSSVPAFMEGHQRYFTWAVLAAGALFLVHYVFAYVRLARQGYSVSPYKVFLLASTGACSIYSWGFNTWGEAFFIMNFFHALQYFGIVWARERASVQRFFRVSALGALASPLAVTLFVGAALAYGAAVEVLAANAQWLFVASIVISILHFWYDGFIWSVRRRQV
jgi:hypothetical protein